MQGLKDRLFTYIVPESLVGLAFTGSQVLVPFGKQMVAGYVVAVDQEIREHLEYELKEIHEVLDPNPLFDEAYVSFLAHVAEYYCAGLQEVVAAAIPSCLVSKLKRHVKLTGEPGTSLSESAALIVSTLKESARGSLNITTLRQRFESVGRRLKPKLNAAAFQKGLRELVEGKFVFVEVEEEGRSTAKTETVIKVGTEAASTAKQKQVLEVLSGLDKAPSITELAKLAQSSPSTISKMIAEGKLVAGKCEVVRDALSGLPEALLQGGEGFSFTDEQKAVFDVLSKKLDERLSQGQSDREGAEPWLLHGVTGSGKTEVYLRLISRALAQGRNALFLVPEISLTPQLSGRLKSRFGDLVSVWHSAISPGERYDTWRRLRSGEVRVLLGARSAILANVPKLGLIILDEEHDSSYKQTSPAPRYNARELAVEKASRTGAMVLFGSATPDLVSFEKAKREARLLSMRSRVFQQAMPKVTMVDMRKQFERGENGVFCRELKDAITDRLEKGEQTVLLINRRGFANHVFCQACGNVSRCKNCSVSLVLHTFKRGGEEREVTIKEGGGYLACHHCGFRQPLKEECSSCHGPFLKESGVGTQKVERELNEALPEARVVRLDSDVAKRRGAYEKVLAQFSRGEADILIGTQMVAKGLDIPKVTLVGVLSADSAFNLPDYRSTERGFQLLTQVAGRAGRGERVGEVILQTWTPDLPALRFAGEHDYDSFFLPELEARRGFDYPPFASLIRLVFSGEDQLLVESVTELVCEELSRLVEDDVDETELKILGPAPCVIERIKGRFRYHLIIKNKAGEKMRKKITTYLRSRRFGPQISMAVDVEALDMI